MFKFIPGSLREILKTPKPSAINWFDHWLIQRARIRYQPIVFPGNEIVPKKCTDRIPDSFSKLEHIGLPEDLSGKDVLDIGCAEGFFVIEAARRGASRSVGCDFTSSRIQIARIAAKTWKFGDRVRFCAKDLYSIPEEYASDIVLCLAVAHHLHGGDHDTWKIISNPTNHDNSFANMIKAVISVSNLTKEMTIWEYAFEYPDGKPDDVDHSLLGRIWTEQGLYKKVDFVGLSQTSPKKDRAIYRAYK